MKFLTILFGRLFAPKYSFLNYVLIYVQGENERLFNIRLIKDMWQTIKKQRFGYLRCIIVLSSVIRSISFAITFGKYLSINKNYYIKKKKLHIIKYIFRTRLGLAGMAFIISLASNLVVSVIINLP